MAVDTQVITDDYAIYNGDCVEVMESMPADRLGLSVYSPPFAGLYNYSSDERDMSNCSSYDEFFDHYRFVVRELARITMPGRMTAVHCMDVPRSNTGQGDTQQDLSLIHISGSTSRCRTRTLLPLPSFWRTATGAR